MVRSRTLVGIREASMPLADVERVGSEGDGLLVGRSGQLAIPLAQRSVRTGRAVTRFVEERVREAVALQGGVPAELARLVRQVERP